MTQKNFQEIIRSVYDEANNQLRTNATGGGGSSTVFIGTPTLHAVVNTSAAGQASVVIDRGHNFIGLVTIANLPDTAAGDLALQTADLDAIATRTALIESDTSDILAALNPLKGNVTLSDSKTNIGLVTLTGGTAWTDPKTFIGLVTAVGDFSTTFSGNVTLDAGSKTQIVGNVTLSDPKGFIGLVTVVGSLSPAAGNVTLDPGSKTGIVGNVTLSDSKTYIGLVTSTPGSAILTTDRTSTGDIDAQDEAITISCAGAGGVGIQTTGTWTGTLILEGTIDGTNWFGIQGYSTQGAATLFWDSTSNINHAVSNVAGLHSFRVRASAWSSGTATVSLRANQSPWDLKSTFAYDGNAYDSNLDLGFAVMGVNKSGNTYHFLNTDATGNLQVDVLTTSGNVTLSDAKTYIGLVTATLGASPAFVGIVTVANPSSFSGNVTLDDGSLTGIVGNVTISDSKGFIGLVSVGGGILNTITAVTDITNPIALKGNLTLSDSKAFIGLVSIGGGVLNTITAVTDITNPIALKGNVTLSDAKTYVGLTTSTLGVGTTFIGLVTANAINAGTNKTLVQLPVGLGNNSLATVAVPTNAQRVKVTSLILNSNVTTEIALKSGVTYLTGNASLGITLFPGGGFVLPGAPDTPQWISLPSGALVVEKRDPGGTVSKVAGHAIYFDEA